VGVAEAVAVAVALGVDVPVGVADVVAVAVAVAVGVARSFSELAGLGEAFGFCFLVRRSGRIWGGGTLGVGKLSKRS
jgi:hypothetical protein